MKITSLGIVFLLLTAAALSQAAADPLQPVLASVESRWGHVYCDLTELKRSATGELSVRYQYRNARPREHRLPHRNLVVNTVALDAANSTLYGVLKDTAGHAIGSTTLDGAAGRRIAAAAAQAHWVRLQAPPQSVTAVTVLVDGCLPFEDVAIGGAPAVAPRQSPLPALAGQTGENPDVMVELTGIHRQSSGFVTLTFRYRNTGTSVFQFPHQRSVYGAYFLDNVNRQKYDVVRDQAQQPLCSETLELDGQTGDRIEPGGELALWAMFPSPAQSTAAVTVYVPLAPPFDDVQISGGGGGVAGAGSAVAGAVSGLEAALQDLGADVTDTEIRIELAADVLFDFDQADIKAEAEPSLSNVATVLKANPGAAVTIEGHTDGLGADAYNQTLSERRAASVKSWLVTKGAVSGAAISTRGWGKTRPVAHNTKPDGSDDPDGRSRNRRVEIVVSRTG